MPDSPIDLDRARSCVTAPRTLRCANNVLYLGMNIIVMAAAVYVVFFRGAGDYMVVGAVAACIVSWIWGGYYMLLCYKVDATGVTRRLCGQESRIDWADLTRAELHRVESQEMASATLLLQTPTATMELSSDLLSLDAVLDLAHDLGGGGNGE